MRRPFLSLSDLWAGGKFGFSSYCGVSSKYSLGCWPVGSAAGIEKLDTFTAKGLVMASRDTHHNKDPVGALGVVVQETVPVD